MFSSISCLPARQFGHADKGIGSASIGGRNGDAVARKKNILK